MARFVHEIANPEIFSVRPEDAVADARMGILSLGITAAPVLDDDFMPVGVVSLRDLIGEVGATAVSDRMTSPAITVDKDATIQDAGRKLSEANVHRLVVVDERGRAVAIVSSMDLVRALLGIPTIHPAAFPHRDDRGLEWTDEVPLALDEMDKAPDGPGLFVLVHGVQGSPEMPVWAEAVPNVRTRLSEILSIPQGDTPQLAYLLAHVPKELRFKAAAVSDPEERKRALAEAEAEVDNSTHQ